MNNKTPGAIIIEGHVQGLSNTRSLGEAGIPVYVIDVSKCIASYSRFCKKFFICPNFRSEDFIGFLINLAEKEELNGWVLIPSNDHIVLNISKNKILLERYYKVITPRYEIVKNIYDKSALLKIAGRLNIPFPETQYFSTESDPLTSGITFPLLTKGRNGLSFYKTFKKKAFLSANESELRSNLKLISSKYFIEDTFTQELIPTCKKNKTISFTAFCVNGDIKTYWMGIKLREHPIQFGTATFAQSINVPQCLEQSRPLVKELNYTGVCEIEYLFDNRDNRYKLIEVNARTWLWVGLAKACGIDYASMIYNYTNNIPYNFPEKYDLNISWINPLTDTFYSFLGVVKGKLRLSEYFRSFKNQLIIDALFREDDIKPGLFYLLNLPSIFLNR